MAAPAVLADAAAQPVGDGPYELIPAPPSEPASVGVGGVPHLAPTGPKWVGSGSCTAANCHGGADRPRVSHGDAWSPVAYSMWVANDPHAQSYNTLLTEASRRMAGKLGLGEAHKERACLVCHAPEASGVELTLERLSTAADGVGCESCHGAAEHWLAPHKTAGWRAWPASLKEGLGFRDLDNLVTRAGNCAQCHLGSPDREVNHDLVAAGHPRLAYEASSLHARLPKHWRDEAVPLREFDAKLWAVGRVASAAAALELLEARAARPEAAWPEFSEYDCYSCHHALAEPSWRRAKGFDGGRPGGLRWGGWNYALLTEALGNGSVVNDPAIAALREEMSRWAPDRARVAGLARDARARLDGDAYRLASRPFGAEELRGYLVRLAEPAAADAPTWDAAAQSYLGLAAVHFSSVAATGQPRSPAGSPAAARRDALVSLERLMRFTPPGAATRYDSPRQWDTTRQQRVRDQLEFIRWTASGG